MIEHEQTMLNITLSSNSQPNNDNHILSDYIPRHVLQEIQESITEVLQTNIIFVSWDGKPITRSNNLDTFCYRFIWKSDEQRPCAHCHRFKEIDDNLTQLDSVQKFAHNDCKLGFSDIIIPIVLGQRIVGYLLTSQIINGVEAKRSVEEYLIKIGLQNIQISNYMKQFPSLHGEYIEQVSKSITSIARMVCSLAYSYTSNARFTIRDSLTGLFNRAYMWDYLESRVAEGNISRKPFAMINIDLNDFKIINDTYGHHAGDKVLQAVAMVLDESIRPADLAIRYGGDEFALILDSVDYDYATAISKRITDGIASLDIMYNRNILHITACCGISIYSGNANADVECLFIDSDNELYKAKAEHKKMKLL